MQKDGSFSIGATVFGIIVFSAFPLIVEAQEQEQAQEKLAQSSQQSVSIGFVESVLPTRFSIQVPYVDFNIIPHASVGTHTNALGMHTDAFFTLPDIWILQHIYVFLQAGYLYSFNNIGIPKPSHTGFFSGALGMSFGEKGSLRNKIVPIGMYRHNIIYRYAYFLDSLNTSQASGMLGYFYTRPTWLVGFIFENDTIAFVQGDKFRTAAAEILSLFEINGAVWGVGAGFTLWGGETQSQARIGFRGRTVDITNGYGGLYSHGILYLAGYLDGVKFSIGWDSEKIRHALQNSAHFFINQTAIGAITNIPDRFFLQIQINPRFSLY